MEIIDGDKINFNTEILPFIQEMNREFMLSGKMEESIDFFREIKRSAIWIKDRDYIVCLLISRDMWGYKELVVTGMYVRKEARNIRLFNFIEKLLESLANDFGCRYIIQGSHLFKSDKFFAYLERKGYKKADYKKDLEDGNSNYESLDYKRRQKNAS